MPLNRSMLSLRSFVLILQHIVLCPKPSFVLVDSLPWIHGWNGTLCHALTVSHHSKLLLTPTRAWTVYAAVHFTVILSCHRHEFKELRLYFILFQILRTPHPGTNSNPNLSSMHVSLRMIHTRGSYTNAFFFSWNGSGIVFLNMITEALECPTPSLLFLKCRNACLEKHESSTSSGPMFSTSWQRSQRFPSIS